MKVARKLVCPRCQNDAFTLTLSERQEASEIVPQVTKMTIVKFLHVGCSNCGWSQLLSRGETG